MQFRMNGGPGLDEFIGQKILIRFTNKTWGAFTLLSIDLDLKMIKLKAPFEQDSFWTHLALVERIYKGPKEDPQNVPSVQV